MAPGATLTTTTGVRVIHKALDADISFIYAADVYSNAKSEETDGKAFKGRRDDVVLATKFFMPMDSQPNDSGGSRKWIMQEAESSLRPLETDYIDLYQVHRPSAGTDVDETLSALTDVVRQSKVRYIGASSYAASQMVEAPIVARNGNLSRFVTARVHQLMKIIVLLPSQLDTVPPHTHAMKGFRAP